MTQTRWIIVEQLLTGRNKFSGLRYPRSAAIQTREEAETQKAAYPPEHGGEIIVISLSEFNRTKRPRLKE